MGRCGVEWAGFLNFPLFDHPKDVNRRPTEVKRLMSNVFKELREFKEFRELRKFAFFNFQLSTFNFQLSILNSSPL